MSVSHQTQTEALITEMWQEEMDEATRLFETAWRGSLAIGGQVKLPDGVIRFQHITTGTAGPILVTTHEHIEPFITADQELGELPVATKYVIAVDGQPTSFRPKWVSEKDYDLSEERKIDRTIFELGDSDVETSYIENSSSPEEGIAILQSTRQELRGRKQHLVYERDRDWPEGGDIDRAAQLRSAQRLRKLLEQLRPDEYSQVLDATFRREDLLGD